MTVREYLRVSARACVCVWCVRRACVAARVCVCVRVRAGGGGWVGVGGSFL